MDLINFISPFCLMTLERKVDGFSLLVQCSVIGFLEDKILYLSKTTESDNLCLLHIDWTFKEGRKLDFGRQLKLINLVLRDEEKVKYQEQFKSGGYCFISALMFS